MRRLQIIPLGVLLGCPVQLCRSSVAAPVGWGGGVVAQTSFSGKRGVKDTPWEASRYVGPEALSQGSREGVRKVGVWPGYPGRLPGRGQV